MIPSSDGDGHGDGNGDSNGDSSHDSIGDSEGDGNGDSNSDSNGDRCHCSRSCLFKYLHHFQQPWQFQSFRRDTALWNRKT